VTRERIVRAAARIVFGRGVAAMSIEQVLTASNASRSQFHRYFVNKAAVIEAAVDFVVVMNRNAGWSRRLLDRCTGRPAARPVQRCTGQARGRIPDVGVLPRRRTSMQERGELDAAPDLAELGAGVTAALQGGLVLALPGRSEQPVRTALRLALDRVALAAAPAGHVELRSGKRS
jgi:TetR/AcrR family transcriptional repressor of nem operon